MGKGKEILRGRSGSPGQVTLTVRIVSKDKAATMKPGKGEALVIPADWHTGPDDEPFLKQGGAFVADSGGPTAHIAIVGKMHNIPTVVGTGEASTVLKDGMKVVVDGLAGYETNPATGVKRPYGAVYEYIPDQPSAAPPSDVAAKLGIKLPDAVMAKLKELQKKG